MIHTTICNSPLGEIQLAAKGDALVGLWFAGQKYFLGSLKEPMERKPDDPVLLAAQNWLDRYFAGERPAASELKLSPAGSEFQKAVWEILGQIPYGEVTSYGEVAKKAAAKLGRQRMSAQAVGGAVGHNPISILIPCHRVVGSNGNLTGYAGGIDKKIYLLTLEKVDMTSLFVPRRGAAL